MSINLLAFPFAGGSSFSYTSWLPYLKEDINLYTFEPNGHGCRLNKNSYDSFWEQIDDAVGFVKKYGTDSEYVLFGHSMGAYVVYEVYKRICEEGFRKPLGIIYSGNIAPHIAALDMERVDVKKLTDDEFVEYVKMDGGLPDQIMDMPEIREVYMPVIRNDYILMQNYSFSGEIESFENNIAVFYGKEDRISQDMLEPWKLYTTRKANIVEFEGGHMFVSFQAQRVAEKCMEYIYSLKVREMEISYGRKGNCGNSNLGGSIW